MSSNARFGLKTAAFAPDAGPEFYIESEAHRRALAHLRHGLKQGEGIVILTGDAGVGKSTILERVAKESATAGVQVLVLDAVASAKADSLKSEILKALEATNLHDDEGLEDVLVERREAGMSYAVFFDNAEKFDNAALEEVRKLSVLFHDGDALLQIALAGDTPMRSILYKSNMDRFRQRVIASYHIPGLTEDQTKEYIEARVKLAGGDTEKVFSPAAVEAIAKHSGGAPGAINALATAAMDLASERGNHHVAGKDVNAAVKGSVARPNPTANAKPQTEENLVAAPKAAPSSAKAPSLSIASNEDTKPRATFKPGRRIATNPVERINGQKGVNGAPRPLKEPLSPAEINNAIQNLSGNTAPVGDVSTTARSTPSKPSMGARGGLSPQEMMMRRPSTPLVAKETSQEPEAVDQDDAQSLIEEPAAPVVKLVQPKSLGPAPKPQGDLWDPASTLDDEEAKMLDQTGYSTVSGKAQMAPEIDAFLSQTRQQLDRLRATLNTLRTETDQLDARRREVREKVSERITKLGRKLEVARSER